MVLGYGSADWPQTLNISKCLLLMDGMGKEFGVDHKSRIIHDGRGRSIGAWTGLKVQMWPWHPLHPTGHRTQYSSLREVRCTVEQRES